MHSIRSRVHAEELVNYYCRQLLLAGRRLHIDDDDDDDVVEILRSTYLLPVERTVAHTDAIKFIIGGGGGDSTTGKVAPFAQSDDSNSVL